MGILYTRISAPIIASVKVQDRAARIETGSFAINLFEYSLDDLSLPDGDTIDGSSGWSYYISKRGSMPENLQITTGMKGKNPDSVISAAPHTGQFLDCIAMENNTHILHIGTEDGEALEIRSQHNDHMPARFSSVLGFQDDDFLSFTHRSQRGFRTTVPDLLEDETVYFQYLCAWNKKVFREDGACTNCFSSNLAVDRRKTEIEDKIIKKIAPNLNA